jgi:hypothetical protein
VSHGDTDITILPVDQIDTIIYRLLVFAALADRLRELPELVPAIDQLFHPERIRYDFSDMLR